jgi:ABC-type microcin C transport system duplicated ATPase subunit YejF
MTALLEIDNLSVAFPDPQDHSKESRVLHEVSLNIEEGSTHGLVGESGSGKSITALSVLRLLDDVSTVRTSGSIRFNGQEMLHLAEEELRAIRGNRIAMIFQEPMTSLNPVYTVGNQLIEPLLLHQQLNKQQAREKALELLERTGIKDPEYRINAYPHQLSGGQRQRVIIAMALACKPDLLIADEPTTALDVTIQQQILELIADIQQEYRMAMLLITHDLPMVKQIADTVSIMHRGHIVEQNTTRYLFDKPEDPYTIHLLDSLPHGEPQPLEGSDTLIRMEDVRCSFTLHTSGFFKKKKTILQAVDGISCTIRRTGTIGIVGESGSGKSTLAQCLLKLQSCQGEIYYRRNGKEVNLTELSNSRMQPLRRELQIVFQDPYSSLSPRLTIGQIVGEGLQVHGVGSNKQERLEMVHQALEEVELTPDMTNRYPHEFSGGQRQRIAIARAIILRPRLLVLDEPTSALDMTIQAQIIDLLKQLQKRFGMTYVFITHDLRVIRSIANDLIVMQQGKAVESGPASELFSNPQKEYTQQLFNAAFGKGPN